MSDNVFAQLASLAHLIKIVHHVPGRVRLKFNPSILKELGDGAVQQLESIDTLIEGIKEVRLNKMAKSATISYDTNLLPMEFFESLAAGNVTPEIERYWNKESQ